MLLLALSVVAFIFFYIDFHGLELCDRRQIVTSMEADLILLCYWWYGRILDNATSDNDATSRIMREKSKVTDYENER